MKVTGVLIVSFRGRNLCRLVTLRMLKSKMTTVRITEVRFRVLSRKSMTEYVSCYLKLVPLRGKNRLKPRQIFRRASLSCLCGIPTPPPAPPLFLYKEQTILGGTDMKVTGVLIVSFRGRNLCRLVTLRMLKSKMTTVRITEVRFRVLSRKSMTEYVSCYLKLVPLRGKNRLKPRQIFRRASLSCLCGIPTQT